MAGITLLPSAPFYEGGALSPLVPDIWDCALAGRPYMLDRQSGEWKHESVPLLRQQADSSDAPSDQSINPESLWRRSQDDWQGGAGQLHRDREGASARRFRSSFGIDVWTEGQISLLPATDEKKSTSDANLFAVVAGTRLYVAHGQGVFHTSDIDPDSPTFTTVTSTHASAVTGLVSTGFRVLIGCSDGIYRTNTGTNAAEKWSALVTGALAYVKGRVMASGVSSDKHKIYNVTDDLAGGAVPYSAPTALFTHPDANFTWVGFAGGPGNQHIYAAGYSGDKSLIYKIPLKDDGTGLDAPIVAAQLPDGEVVRSIGEYLGQILLGTDEGVRFASPGSGGDLTVGALLDTGSPCRCFEGQGPHVWFGWEGYDAEIPNVATQIGLGRFSLEEFAAADVVAPAYASDLMVTGTGAVTAVVTFDGRRFFAVAGDGFYAEEPSSLTPFGLVTSGQIDYRLPEDKVAMYLTVHHQSDDGGSHRASLAVEGGEAVELATHSTADTRFLCGEARGRSFEWTLAIFRDGSDVTVGPTVLTVMLEGYPTTRTVKVITAPLLLADTYDTRGGVVSGFSPTEERAFLRGLRDSRRVVPYQEYRDRYSVVVEDYVWVPSHVPEGLLDPCGTWLAKLKEI